MLVKTLPYPEEARAIRLDYNGPRWTAPHEVQLLCWRSLLRKLWLVLLLCAGSASAATVTLAWDPSPGTNVAG